MEEKRNLLQAEPGVTYSVKKIDTEDPEMNSFLLRLGCYEGEPVTVVSKKRKSCVVVIKEGRYSLDDLLAEAIIV
ncbi:MAG: ferrous iron transport protein A [Oscillospiraceae bacterium]|nr:ferrous iron transport protein A [Oscillospiraceae bacterium]